MTLENKYTYLIIHTDMLFVFSFLLCPSFLFSLPLSFFPSFFSLSFTSQVYFSLFIFVYSYTPMLLNNLA